VSGFVGRLGGHRYLRLGPDFVLYGDGIHDVDPQPYTIRTRVDLARTLATRAIRHGWIIRQTTCEVRQSCQRTRAPR
jgi:hypothetical protein